MLTSTPPPDPVRSVFYALLLLVAAPVALAQTGTVIGRVVDVDNGLALPTASVALWEVSATDSTLVTGVTASIDGDIRVEAVPTGTYDVVASFVGYDAVRRAGVEVGAGETDLGTIRLAPSAEALGEVSVTGQRPQVQRSIDRTVYDTADDPVADGGTATDVLATLPSVDVDVDGNVSLRGAGNVAVFINGRPAPVSGDFLASYLQSLPAGSVDRVEIIPNPSAAFEPDGVGGVINIVLKQNTDRGVGGTLTAGTDSNGGVDGTAAVTYGKGPWSLAATVGLRNDMRPGGGDGFRINRFEQDPDLDVEPSQRFEDEADDRTRTSALVNLSADYAFSRATTLTSQFQVGTRSGDETELGQTFVQDLDGTPRYGFSREVTEVEDGQSLDARLGLIQQFGEGHRLTVEGRAEASDETEANTYLETLLSGQGNLSPARRADQSEQEREGSLQVDYTRSLGALRLDVGYKGDWEQQESGIAADSMGASGAFVPDLGQSNTFDYAQAVQALYVQAGGEWGPFGVQAGLRLEDARTTFDLLTTDETFDNDYRSLFPSAFLSFAPTEATTFKASYSRRVNRPRTRALNPFPSFDDPLNIRQGNPALRPEYVSSFEAGVTQFVPWGSVSLTPYYRHTTDVIRRFLTIRDDGVTVRTFENLDTSDSYGVELISSFEDLAGLSGYASLEGFRLKTDGTTTSTGDVGSDGFSWGGRANVSYGFGDRLGLGDLALQATARYSAPIETEQARIDSRISVNLALRQKLFDDRASLTVQVRDPFNQNGFAYTLDQPELFQELSRTWGGRQVGVTLAYSFGRQERSRDRQRGPEGGDFEGGEEF